MKKRPRVCVVGSINMDMVTTTDKIPAQGETMLGGSFHTSPGGKGANQAIAAARLDANVSLIGAVGDDSYGHSLLKHFKNEKINTNGIEVFPETSTGIATIIISENDNRIIVSSGANALMTPEVVDKYKAIIKQSDIILLQFETPMETGQYTVGLAAAWQIPIIINPAPYAEIPGDILKKATYFTPNDGEATAMQASGLDEGIMRKLITTKGKNGATFYPVDGGIETIPAYEVGVQDTTGAGDTFNGAFATAFAATGDIRQSITFANAAAALSVTKLGAQTGMPTREEVEEFLHIYTDKLI